MRFTAEYPEKHRRCSASPSACSADSAVALRDLFNPRASVRLLAYSRRNRRTLLAAADTGIFRANRPAYPRAPSRNPQLPTGRKQLYTAAFYREIRYLHHLKSTGSLTPWISPSPVPLLS
jgi:hypothetical protein